MMKKKFDEENIFEVTKDFMKKYPDYCPVPFVTVKQYSISDIAVYYSDIPAFGHKAGQFDNLHDAMDVAFDISEDGYIYFASPMVTSSNKKFHNWDCDTNGFWYRNSGILFERITDSFWYINTKTGVNLKLEANNVYCAMAEVERRYPIEVEDFDEGSIEISMGR